MKRQLFIFSSAIVEAISIEEIEASYVDMASLGIAQPPYDEFDIEVMMNSIMHVVGDDGSRIENKDRILRLVYGPGENWDVQDSREDQGRDRGREWFSIVFAFREACSHDAGRQLRELIMQVERFRRALIVLLATRNVIKHVKEHKLARLGIGRGHYAATTKLEIGVRNEYEGQNAGMGVERRPHLRRGHKREQRFGVGLSQVKQIFIAPVFVNADKEWIGERTGYRLTSHQPPVARQRA